MNMTIVAIHGLEEYQTRDGLNQYMLKKNNQIKLKKNKQRSKQLNFLSTLDLFFRSKSNR